MAAGGHFVKKKVSYRSEMARNAIKSYFRTSKIATGGHFVKNLKKKFRMDLKWPEMPSKMNFGHPKWTIDLKWPEVAIESDFRTSKIAAEKTNSISI